MTIIRMTDPFGRTRTCWAIIVIIVSLIMSIAGSAWPNQVGSEKPTLDNFPIEEGIETENQAPGGGGAAGTVAATSPLKRGLKPTYRYHSPLRVQPVAATSPLKRGLKL